MTPEQLLQPRYLVIADYPGSVFKVGQILESDPGRITAIGYYQVDKYPHLFRRLEWWKYRDEKDMPKYIKFISNVLRLCDGCEALELSVGATCTKPLLYAVLFFFVRGQITKI